MQDALLPADAALGALVKAAVACCGASIGLISLIDGQGQWIKASPGLPGIGEIEKDLALCARTIGQEGLLEVAFGPAATV